MRSLFGKRYTQKFNTADFDDEDFIDMLEAFEALCEIEFSQSEVGELASVGELYDLLNMKARESSTFDPLWCLLCRMIKEYAAMRDPIERDTMLFREDAKERR